MKKVSIFLIAFIALVTALRHNSAPQLTILVGNPKPETRRILESQGAHVDYLPDGMRIRCDDAGLHAVWALADFHRRGLELCLENLANCNTLRTVEGTPYQRKHLVVDPQGQVKVAQVKDDYRWVYDPNHPCAETTGHHAGYVAAPNIVVAGEVEQAREHLTQAECYRRAIERMSAQRRDVVAALPVLAHIPDSPEPAMATVSLEQLGKKLHLEIEP